MAEWTRRDAAVVWHGFTQMAAYDASMPVIVDRAEGRYLVDVAGRRYFDGISSLWVTTLGHRVPEIDAAIHAQLNRVAHSTMLGNGSRVVVELAEALAPVVPVDGPHFLFASDGACAVEQALKIAVQYWVNQGIDGRHRFLALGSAYHGDTVGALSLGDGGFGTAMFDPLRFPMERTPGYDDPDWAAAAISAVERHHRELAAMVIEPLVQGAAGMLVAEPGDVAAVADACRRAGVLLVCDEVATGFGRTGALFASDICGIRPDLMCLGKGITGGYLPMSVTVAADHVQQAFLGEDLGPRTLSHGHSYGGNALAAAAAVAHLALLADGSVLANVGQRAEQLGDALARRVAGHRGVGAVRQRGLMVGIELAAPSPDRRWGRRVCAGAVARGVLLRPLGDVVVLMPPLTTTAGEVDRLVDVLVEALDEVVAADEAMAAGQVAAGQVAAGQVATGQVAVSGGLPAGQSWAKMVDQRCRETAAAGRWRQPRSFDAQGLRGRIDGHEQMVVSFAGNDYLGLSGHPAVVAAARDAIARWGTGSGASRLVTGSRPIHHQLESALAQWKGTEQAVVLPTGFAANLAVLTTFGDATVRICSDERNHASIVDGARLARAEVVVYRHGDVDHLRQLMAGSHGPVLVVTDTVFSMDGDEAPLAAIADCCRHFGALLVLDEAHGVLSPDPAPLLGDVACLRVGTLSKTLGSLGGFVAGPRRFMELLVNHARSYIFTTAPSPPDMAAALAALDVVRSAEGDRLRSVLAGYVERLRPGQRAPIVPIMLGDEDVAVAASDELLRQGFWVPAIRPPTVAPGTSRLRVTLSAGHRADEVDQLAEALDRVAGGGQ